MMLSLLSDFVKRDESYMSKMQVHRFPLGTHIQFALLQITCYQDIFFLFMKKKTQKVYIIIKKGD